MPAVVNELLASAAMGSIDDLQLAFDASDRAAELALAHFAIGVSSTLKADGTPVTETDRAVEYLRLSPRRRCGAVGGRPGPVAPSSRPGHAMSPLPLIELVRGEIDAFLAERYHKWDHAPWVLLVEEAGGRFTDRTGGHATDRGGGLYSNATCTVSYSLHCTTRNLPDRHGRFQPPQLMDRMAVSCKWHHR